MIKVKSDTLTIEQVKRMHKMLCLLFDCDLSLSIDQKEMNQEFAEFKNIHSQTREIEKAALGKKPDESIKDLRKAQFILADFYSNSRVPEVRDEVKARITELAKVIEDVNNKKGFDKLEDVKKRMEFARDTLQPDAVIDEYVIAMNDLVEIAANTNNETLVQQAEETVEEFREHIIGHELIKDLNKYKEAYEIGLKKIQEARDLRANLGSNTIQQNEKILTAHLTAIKSVEDIIPKLKEPTVIETAKKVEELLRGELQSIEGQMVAAIKNNYERQKISSKTTFEKYKAASQLVSNLRSLDDIVSTPEGTQMAQAGIREATDEMLAMKKDLGIPRMVVAKLHENNNS